MKNSFINLRNNEIIGCEKDSLTWWHEKGHIVYNESERGMRNDFNKQNYFNATIFFLIVSLFTEFGKLFVVFSSILWISYAIYEEAWCWHFAFKHKK